MDDDALDGAVPRERAAIAWAAERIASHLRGRVLDVGCGDGRFLPPDGVGVDRDLERLRRAASRGGAVVRADARALPFRDASFDTAMANRMLNDAGGIDEVLAEIVRVLSGGGTLLVLTLASPRPSALRRLHDDARAALGLRERRERRERLDVENGEAILHRRFAQVSREDFGREYRFADPSAALAHYAGQYLTHGIANPAQRAALFERVRAAILAAQGELVDEERAALFVARKGDP